MPGYAKEIFPLRLDERYLCNYCNHVLNKPVQAYCGHRYCQSCMENIQRSKIQYCASCFEEKVDEDELKLSFKSIFPDNAIRWELGREDAKCIKPTCSWSGIFKHYENHFEHCPPLQVNISGNITEDLNVGQLKNAPNGIRLIGDPTYLLRLLNSLSDLQSSLGLAATVEDKTKVLKGLSNNTVHLDNEVAKLQVKTAALDELILAMFAKMQCSSAKIHAMLVEGIRLEGQFQERERSLVTSRVPEHQAHTSYDGVLVWKITGAKEFCKSSSTLWSPCFYATYQGYKMCAKLQSTGCGPGETARMTLHFILMKGDYDAILQWPFKEEVTFMLLHQGGDDNIEDSFRPDPESSSFKQPTTEMNVASGCGVFTNLQLSLDDTRYVKDDVMFIKIAVDTSDLEVQRRKS